MYNNEEKIMIIDSFEIPELAADERIFDSHAHYDDDSFDSDRDALFADLDRKSVV